MTHGKISISVPHALLGRLERVRTHLGRSRSEMIQLAIEQWIRSLDLDRATAQYVAGYLRFPEDDREGRALVRAQVKDLEPEDWS